MLKIVIALAALWGCIYTVSYGFFEYKNKNPRGAIGVWLLVAATIIALAGSVFG